MFKIYSGVIGTKPRMDAIVNGSYFYIAPLQNLRAALDMITLDHVLVE